jgi:molybdenum cofactor biosynthesis enzyme MoaA
MTLKRMNVKSKAIKKQKMIETIQRFNSKLRIKVTDRCNMHCWFCHAEGAPESEDLVVNEILEQALREMHNVFQHAHITGGEPLLYDDIGVLLDMLSNYGYNVALTSNGCFSLDFKTIEIVKRLEYLNISFHSLRGEYYSALTHSDAGEKIVSQIANNILTLSKILPVRINTVVSGDGKGQYLDEMVHFSEEVGCELKLVPELKTKALSLSEIESLLNRNHFKKFQTISISPGSNIRDRYRNQNGAVIEVKKLAPFFPNSICSGCLELDSCNEGFSFFRIGGNPLYCQACIKHPPVPYQDFMDTQWNILKSEYINIK